MANTIISLTLYKWKTLANGEHPFMIRITQGRERKYFSINESCSARFWDFKKNKLKRNHPQHDILERLLSKRLESFNKERLILKERDEHFTPDDLIEQAVKPVQPGTILTAFDTVIEQLEAANKIGNARVYKDTRRIIKIYTKGKDTPLTRINKDWLERFERYLVSEELAGTTISLYFRTLRSLYNKAIELKYVRMEHYPFNKVFKVSKFETDTEKRAITKTELTRIKVLDLSGYPEAEIAQKYFLFSFYGCGINFIDIAKLTGENIKSGRINYTRSKTEAPVSFKLRDEAKEIIDFFNPARSMNRNEYLFPILDRTTHITATQIDNRYKKIMGEVNKGLKTVAELAKITTDLTFYVARHSYATISDHANVPLSIIMESMGHKDLKTTQNYLKSFPRETSDQLIGQAIAI